MLSRGGRAGGRTAILLALTWACALVVACLNPRPEEDPSVDTSGPPRPGEPTGTAGASGAPDVDLPGGSAGAGGSGLGSAGSGSDQPANGADGGADAGTDAGSDAGTADTTPDAGPSDAGQP